MQLNRVSSAIQSGPNRPPVYRQKQILYRPVEFNSNPQTSLNKTDKASFSSIATQTAPVPAQSPKTEGKSSLTSFGEKYFNQPVLDNFRSYREKPAYAPIITYVDIAARKGVSIQELERTAIRATKQIYPQLSPRETLTMAYRSLMASVIETKYADANFFNGERDKVFHYFTSAAMTLTASNNVPLLSAKLAGKAVLAIGWLKEVASIPGNGFGHDDMDANRLGINAAVSNLKKLENNQPI